MGFPRSETVPVAEAALRKLERLTQSDYSICREEAVWLLEYMRASLAGDPATPVQDRSAAQWKQQFRCFADVALLLIRRGLSPSDLEIERLKAELREQSRVALP
ncbi:MAG: hypothetical protein J7639_20045 [Paenibacillaceae bacterium]|nr:hypothetical protein [Paenibacillaceae bacterium]